MKKLVSLKWIFCLLGSAMFFACSEDQEEIVGKNNLIDDIQITNGMLVFPNHKTLESVIGGEENSYTAFVSVFKSQEQMFEEVIAAESKQMDYLDSLSGEALENAPKHTSLYESALKEGLIKEVFYTDGTSTYDYNLAVPYYASVLNKDGFFAVRDTLYQVTKDYIKVWVGANLYETSVLAKSINSDEGKNITVFDYKKGKNAVLENANSLSRVSFPAPPSNLEIGIVQILDSYGGGSIEVPEYFIHSNRYTLTIVDKIGLALPKYTRDLYLQFTSQRKVNGSNSYGYYSCSFDLALTLQTNTDGITSERTTINISGIDSKKWYTIYPAFNLIIEGKTQLVTEDPYIYIMYASTWFYINGRNNLEFGNSSFKMERSNIRQPLVSTITGEPRNTQWLNVLDD